MIKQELLVMCNNSCFENNKLPPETELTKYFNVSIGTVRKALTFMETEGYIVKRHGSGNYILRSAIDPKMRVDIAYDMDSLIQNSGFDNVSKKLMRYYFEKGDIPFLKPLSLSKNEELLIFEFLYSADEHPAIASRYYLPTKLIKQEKPWELTIKNFDAFIWDYCELEPIHSITTWKAQIADDAIQELFGLDFNQPMIRWEQIAYDIHDTPILGSEAFFNPDIMNLRSLFRWNFQPRK